MKTSYLVRGLLSAKDSTVTANWGAPGEGLGTFGGPMGGLGVAVLFGVIGV